MDTLAFALHILVAEGFIEGLKNNGHYIDRDDKANIVNKDILSVYVIVKQLLWNNRMDCGYPYPCALNQSCI